jgi:WD40 repeat protein
VEGAPRVIKQAFSPDGQRLAVSYLGGAGVKIWDTATGRAVGALSLPAGADYALRFSPDGRRLATASGDPAVTVWDITTGKLVRSVIGITWALAFSPDGKRVATTHGRAEGADSALGVRVWGVPAPSAARILEGHKGWVFTAAFSPDGKRLASGSLDRTVKIWDVAGGSVLRTLNGHSLGVTDVAFSPDGRYVASVASPFRQTVRPLQDKLGELKVWEANSGREQFSLSGQTLPGARGHFRVPAFSPDGKYLAFAVWQPREPSRGWREGDIRVCAAQTGKELYRLRLADQGAVTFLAFSPDGKRLIAVGMRGAVCVWDVASRQVLTAFKVVGSPTAQLSPDGKQLVTHDGVRGAIFWDTDTGRQVKAVHEPGLFSFRTSLAFSPDGRRLAAGSPNGHIRIRAADNGLELLTFRSFQGGQVYFATFSPDGRLLATPFGNDITIWDGTPQPANPAFGG